MRKRREYWQIKVEKALEYWGRRLRGLNDPGLGLPKVNIVYRIWKEGAGASHSKGVNTLVIPDTDEEFMTIDAAVRGAGTVDNKMQQCAVYKYATPEVKRPWEELKMSKRTFDRKIERLISLCRKPLGYREDNENFS